VVVVLAPIADGKIDEVSVMLKPRMTREAPMLARLTDRFRGSAIDKPPRIFATAVGDAIRHRVGPRAVDRRSQVELCADSQYVQRELAEQSVKPAISLAIALYGPHRARDVPFDVVVRDHFCFISWAIFSTCSRAQSPYFFSAYFARRRALRSNRFQSCSSSGNSSSCSAVHGLTNAAPYPVHPDVIIAVDRTCMP
jgi:hypothetical protein